MTAAARTLRRRPPLPPARAAVAVASLAVALLGLLAAARLLDARQQLLLAGGDLRATRSALIKQDGRAGATVDRAQRRVARASASVSAFPLPVLRFVPLLGSPVRASVAAARAAQEGVAAARILVEASSSFPTSAGLAVDGRDLSAFHAAARRSQLALAEAEERLTRADAALAGPAGAALPQVSGPVRAARKELARSRQELATAGRGLSLLETLTSRSADVRLLVLGQDSLELRPTGGYIGSYGVLHFSRGTVELEKFEATEDLPAAQPAAVPPFELVRFLPKTWGLSNANWWPHFPASAATARDLFLRQAGGEVDGVLAITERATARLVGALGPLSLPSYPKPVTEEGFETRVVYEVELKRPLDQPRKKFLLELADVVFARIFDLPPERLPSVAGAVRRSLGTGDVQLWFADPALQGRLAGMVVAGELPRPEGDMLMVVDANIVASKANLEARKNVDYKVERDRKGRWVGRVRVEVRNEGVKSSINPLYGGYLRVYAPAGARLLHRHEGQVAQAATDGPFEVFSQLLVVDPGGTGVATFEYLLPERVGRDGRYHLTWVRQVGTPDDRLRVEVAGRRADVDPAGRELRLEQRLAS